MSTRRHNVYEPDSCYWYDSLCSMYFNKVTKEWQRRLNPDCLYNTNKQAEEDKLYFYDSDDIKLRPHLTYALAA